MVKFKSDSSVKRVAKNGVFSVLRFGVFALSGIIFIPFLARQYGLGAYGLIALAGFLTQYVGMISRCVGTAVARYINIALNQNDWKQANEIFSTALVANLGFILLQVPLFALGVWKLDWIIDFSPEIATDFRILVICNILVFFISMITGVLGTPIQASNRLDLVAKVDILRLLLRLILLFALIHVIGAKLWIIGAVDLALALLNSFVVFRIYKNLAKQLVFKLSHLTRKWIRPVLDMAGWMLVSALGFSLFVQTDIWMINRFVSTQMAGVYAVLLVWPNFIKQIGKVLESLLGPTLMIDFAAGRKERMADSVMLGATLLNYFAAVAVGVLCAVARIVLPLWMGEGADAYAPLLTLMSLFLIFTLGEAVLWQVFPAINKVRFVGLTNLVTGMLNILISILLIFLGFGVVGVAIGTAIAILLKCAVVIPWKVCQELDIPLWEFVKIYFGSSLLFLFVWQSVSQVIKLWESSVVGALALSGVLFVLGGVTLYRVHKQNIWRLYKALVK